MTVAQDWLTFLLAMGALLSLLVGWLRWVRPRYRRTRSEVTAIRDSILGRDAIRDSITGREIEPALPGVGTRLANQEEHLGVLADAVASLAKSHAVLDDHEKRIAALEVASVERIVSRAESAAGWRAMEAAALATPDQVVEPDRPDPPQ
jgi:hypothetical protein